MSDFVSKLDGRSEVSALVAGREAGAIFSYVAAGHEMGYRLTSYYPVNSHTFRIKVIRDDDPMARERAAGALYRIRSGYSWQPFPPGPHGYVVTPEQVGKSLIQMHLASEASSGVRKKYLLVWVGIPLLGSALSFFFGALFFAGMFFLLGFIFWVMSIGMTGRREKAMREAAEVVRIYHGQWHR